MANLRTSVRCSLLRLALAKALADILPELNLIKFFGRFHIVDVLEECLVVCLEDRIDMRPRIN